MTVVLLVVSVVLLLLSLGLRWQRLRTVEKTFRDWLADPDPRVRIAAVQVLTQQGLRQHADLLVDLATHEQNPGVRAALAEAVRRHRWEPPDHPRLAQLRAWAEQFGRRAGV